MSPDSTPSASDLSRLLDELEAERGKLEKPFNGDNRAAIGWLCKVGNAFPTLLRAAREREEWEKCARGYREALETIAKMETISPVHTAQNALTSFPLK